MSLSAIANYFGLHWTTVKDIEKQHLKKKYKTVSLVGVRVIGIDEIYVGKNGARPARHTKLKNPNQNTN